MTVLARAAVWLGARVTRRHFHPPVNHWRNRVWDGDRAEQHALLGAAYREERAYITAMLRDAARDARVLDVACGTGRYTRAALHAGAAHVTALDVSPDALDLVGRRCVDAAARGQLRTLEADVFRPLPSNVDAPFDVVMCLDAIHHLGPLTDVLTRLYELVRPGGVVLGDVWTADHFHEFQRLRRGPAEHTLASLRFAAAAVGSAVWRRPVSHAARSQLLPAEEVTAALVSIFGPDTHVERSRYWVRFRGQRAVV